MPNRSSYITVIGNAASGKTTLSEALAKELKAALVPADELFELNPFFPLTLKDRVRWSFTSDVWFLQQRVQAMARVPQLLHKQSVVVDSGLLMGYVYAHSRLGVGFITPEEWQLYRVLFADLTKALQLPPQSVVVYIEADMELLLQRIKERGSDPEQVGHAKDYLSGLQKSLAYVVEELKKQKIKVITVQADETDPRKVTAQIG